MKLNIMQNSIKSTILCLSVMIIWVACDSYDDGGGSLAETERIARLSRTWEASKVTYQDVDVTLLDFSDFTITFNENGTWTTTDGDPAFGPGGNWEFPDNNPDLLLMDGVEVRATLTFDGQQLDLSFVLNNNTIGRTQGIDGGYLFNLTPVEQN